MKIHQITVSLTKEGPFYVFSQDDKTICEGKWGDKEESLRVISDMMDRLKPVTTRLT